MSNSSPASDSPAWVIFKTPSGSFVGRRFYRSKKHLEPSEHYHASADVEDVRNWIERDADRIGVPWVFCFANNSDNEIIETWI